MPSSCRALARMRKPVVAAVSGHAIGGGCEIALMCDIIIASETARFALPETTIGIIPGAGGTQRLTRIVGKAVAMDMILTGRAIDTVEALTMGLVSRVVPAGTEVKEAVAIAARLASLSRPVLQLAKEAMNNAYETHLQEGLYVERRLLYATFALDDRREGMNAFAGKRKPTFHNR
ncbi:enoyl-CoA hydratase-related protein [Paracoccus sp. (in: a-proteobacteria)]|uniref:enoyl-CoA hydratase-related protein n=1 Tax=Paracoccus sp. TaxID=267 RepID=UPI002AFF2863|nr:enoyl-CoA hydratase-related protein [Paracoccus sp. (in: a-proteobacteria)]